MERKIYRIFVLGILVLVAVVIYLFFPKKITVKNNPSQLESCKIKNPDPDGYLFKICQYLTKHKDTIIPNKNPNDYSIKSIEPGRYGLMENGREMGPDVILVLLDCCGTGDIAFITKATQEVIFFSPGDK